MKKCVGRARAGQHENRRFFVAARSRKTLKKTNFRKTYKKHEMWKKWFSYWFFCYVPHRKNSQNRGSAVRRATAKTHEKRAAQNRKMQQKSSKICINSKKNASLQTKGLRTPIFIDFRRFWESPGEPKSVEIRKKIMPKIMYFLALEINATKLKIKSKMRRPAWCASPWKHSF